MWRRLLAGCYVGASIALVILLQTSEYTGVVLGLGFCVLVISLQANIHLIRRVIYGRPYLYSRVYRIRLNGGQHTNYQWVNLKRRYGYKCVKCQKPETTSNPLTKDHIIPVSKGGTDDISNIQPLCRSCNSAKGSKVARYR